MPVVSIHELGDLAPCKKCGVGFGELCVSKSGHRYKSYVHKGRFTHTYQPPDRERNATALPTYPLAKLFGWFDDLMAKVKVRLADK